MRMICPGGCERPTYWQRRPRGSVRPPTPAGILAAVTSEGLCTTCWRARKGIVRQASSGGVTIVQSTYRQPLTDADIERERVKLAKMWAARRRRGIPPEGADPENLAGRGLFLIEV